MRKLYISTMAAYMLHRTTFATTLTTHWMALYDPSNPSDRLRWEAAGKPVVVSTDHSSEFSQDKWESNPEVTVLPDPLFEGNMPLSKVKTKAENLNNNFDHISHAVVPPNLGMKLTDTVIDIHKKLARWHPGFKLRI